MDILNWIFLRKSKSIKTSIVNADRDLIPLGAAVGWKRRDDYYHTYGMTAKSLIPNIYDKGVVTQITGITTAVTLDTHSGVITTVSSTLAASADKVFNFNNVNITDNAVVLLSLAYNGSGTPVVNVVDLGAGLCGVQLTNVHPTDPLNATVKIHFTVIA